MASLFRKGLSLRAIGVDVGRGTMTVRAHLLDMGFEMRPRGTPAGRPRNPVVYDEKGRGWKRCSRCGRRKLAERFGHRGGNLDGRAGICLACVRRANRRIWADPKRRAALLEYQRFYRRLTGRTKGIKVLPAENGFWSEILIPLDPAPLRTLVEETGLSDGDLERIVGLSAKWFYKLRNEKMYGIVLDDIDRTLLALGVPLIEIYPDPLPMVRLTEADLGRFLRGHGVRGVRGQRAKR